MTAALLLLLLLTNVAWAIWAVTRSVTPSAAATTAAPDELARRDAVIADLRARLVGVERRAGESVERGPRAAAPRGRATPDAASSTEKSRPPAPVHAESPTLASIDMNVVNRRTEEWRGAIRQVGDDAKRDAAWRSVRDAAAGADRSEVLASLRTISWTIDVKLDRTGIRELILPQLDAPEPPVRIVAWNVLLNLGLEPSDFPKLRAQVLDGPPKTRANLLLVLNQARHGVIAGEDAEMVRKLFDVPGAGGDAVFGLQGARLPEEVVAKVLEYARGGDDAAAKATDFVLGGLPDMPRSVVDFLFERATKGDTSPIDGFPRTVRAEDAPYAAEKLRALFAARSEPNVRRHLVEVVARLRDPANDDWLARIRDDAGEDAIVRDAARQALESPRRRR
jgi:hypothetical protein